ncbi:MAG: cytochrome c oxidase assembly protein [Proteobacteria bacterium]|nr:cytochrome c oxidase assembly protein [Pseudomonadota bacterium]
MSSRAKNRHVLLLLGLAAGMFGFAFALVPLYDILCDITGINGKPALQAALHEEIEASESAIDREVTIQFLAKAARGMPWEFRPLENKMTVRPGEMNRVMFYVRNRSNHSVTGQAVPSISPGQAALYFKKIECFCFEQQELAAGGEMEIGVSFFVDVDMPAKINELTLSYTMFRVGDVEHEHLISHFEAERDDT